MIKKHHRSDAQRPSNVKPLVVAANSGDMEFIVDRHQKGAQQLAPPTAVRGFDPIHT